MTRLRFAFAFLLLVVGATSNARPAEANGSSAPASASPEVCAGHDHVPGTKVHPDRRLWRVPVTGGPNHAVTPPVELHPVVTEPVIQDDADYVVSPDGSRFASTDQGAVVFLGWTDASREPVVVPTASATSHRPVRLVGWSPDNTKVAVLGDEGLLVVTADGTTAPSVRAPDPATGWAWSPDSTRLAFVDATGHPTVATATGPPVLTDVSHGKLAEINASNQRYFAPVWSPNSAMVVWFSAAHQVVTARSDGSGVGHVLNSTSLAEDPRARWSPDSNTVLWDGAFSAPADGSAPQTFLAGGLNRPRLVPTGAEGNLLSIEPSAPVISPSGSRIAFLASPLVEPAVRHLYTAKLDGTDRVDVSGPVPGDDSVTYAVWAHQSDTLALTMQGATTSVYVVGAAGPVKLGDHAVSGLPSFDPFDRRVVWRTDPNGNFTNGHVVSAPVDGSQPPVQLDDFAFPVSSLEPTIAFAPNGDVLIERHPSNTTGYLTWIQDAPFDAPARHLQPDVFGAVPSPDRKHYATWPAIYGYLSVFEADGSNEKRFTHPPPYRGFSSFWWTPDSQHLLLGSVENGYLYVEIINADGTGPVTQLNFFGLPGIISEPTFSADGSRLAFVSESGNGLADIYIAQTGVPFSAVPTGYFGKHPMFAPTGDLLAFADGTQVKTMGPPYNKSQGTVPTTIATVPAATEIQSLAWRPQADVLAVGTFTSTPPAGDPLQFTTTTDLFLAHPDGSPQQHVANGAHPTWAPDGAHLGWEQIDATQTKLYDQAHGYTWHTSGPTVGRVALADGSNPRTIASAEAVFDDVTGFSPFLAGAIAKVPSSRHLAFSPDGSVAAFVGVAADLDAAAPLRAARGSEAWRFPTWTHDACAVQAPGYHALAAPTRVLDTRDGTGAPSGRVGPGGHVDLQVSGTQGLPTSHVSSVILNTTAVGSTTATHVTVSPAGSPLPATSNINIPAGDIRPNLVVAKVGTDGKVTLTNNAGELDLVADMVGWLDDGDPSVTAGGLAHHPLSPTRALDTRDSARVGPGAHVDVALPSAVPVGASSVVMNVTGVDPTAFTHITAAAAGSPLPNTSNLNLPAGSTRPNVVVVPIGPGNKVSLWNNAGEVDLLADVVGYFAGTEGPGITSVAPARLYDTRDGTGGSTGHLGPGASVAVQVAGVGGVPADATAVVVNLTGVSPSTFTHLTAWPATDAMPVASNLNLPPGLTAANLAVVKLGADGRIGVFNNAGTVDVIIDVMGYVS